MRSTIGIVLGFAVLIGGSLYISGIIESASENIQAQLDQAETMIYSQEWDQAADIVSQAYQSWQPLKKWWALVLNHSTLNNIEISYLRVQQYVLNKEAAHTLAELETLKLLLNDIPESQTIRIYNIL